MPAYTFDNREFLTRIVKYLIEGLVIAVVAALLPSKNLRTSEIVLLALTGAALVAPSPLLALAAPLALALSAEAGRPSPTRRRGPTTTSSSSTPPPT